jgi:hypothetical protein
LIAAPPRQNGYKQRAPRPLLLQVLEIGLGCGQSNVGAGVRLWNEVFKNSQGRKLDLHVMEYDGTCARLWEQKWAKAFPHVNLRLFTGDQSSEVALKAILNQSGGGYDAIVEDGGHSMLQQQVSLRVLFPALKPGGFCTQHQYTRRPPTLSHSFWQRPLTLAHPLVVHLCLSICAVGEQTLSKTSRRAT